MNKQLLPVLLLLFAALPVLGVAQNSKVTNGVLSFQESDFASCVADMTTALRDPSLLSEGNLVKAHSFLGRSYSVLYQHSMDTANRARQQKALAVLNANPNWMLDAHKSFKKAKELDVRNRLTLEDKNFYPGIIEALYLKASQLLFSTPPQAEQALEFANPSVEMIESNAGYSTIYQAFMVQGYAFKGASKPDEAIKALEKCIVSYKAFYATAKQTAETNRKPVPAHDNNIGQSYLMLVELYATHLKDFNKVNATFEEAKTMFAGVPNVLQNLTAVEVQLYASNPELYEQGLAKARAAVEADPRNVFLLVSYAGLVEKRDTMQAIELYKRAVAVDPAHFVANFNLAGKYIDLARKYFTEANLARGAEEARLKTLQQDALASAYKHMNAALAAKPNDCSTLKALKNITAFYTEKLAENATYDEKLRNAGCGN